jgi:tripartite-type tricarboxylate transporter receptor subunit TctC
MRAPLPAERAKSQVAIVGIPFDCGAHPVRVGARLGPTAIREQSAGVDLNHVPYKGTGPALIDVVGGQIQSTFTTTPGAIPHVKAGRLRALGVSTRKRSAGAPDVPTFEESGIRDFEAANWYGFQAPAGLPKPILARLSQEILRAAELPDVRERFIGIALDPTTMPPEPFQKFIASEVRKWSDVVKAAKIKPDQ